MILCFFRGHRMACILILIHVVYLEAYSMSSALGLLRNSFFKKKYFISEINKQSLSLIFFVFSFLLWTCYTLYNLHLPILNHPIRRKKNGEEE
jgi:hypothetical protein